MILRVRKDRGNSFKFRKETDKTTVKTSEVQTKSSIVVIKPINWTKTEVANFKGYCLRHSIKLTFINKGDNNE